MKGRQLRLHGDSQLCESQGREQGSCFRWGEKGLTSVLIIFRLVVTWNISNKLLHYGSLLSQVWNVNDAGLSLFSNWTSILKVWMAKLGEKVKVTLVMVTTVKRYHVALVEKGFTPAIHSLHPMRNTALVCRWTFCLLDLSLWIQRWRDPRKAMGKKPVGKRKIYFFLCGVRQEGRIERRQRRKKRRNVIVWECILNIMPLNSIRSIHFLIHFISGLESALFFSNLIGKIRFRR